MDKFTRYLESLIFSSHEAITTKEIHEALLRFTGETFSNEAIEDGIQEIKERYARDEEHFMELVYLNGGYQFMTKMEYNGLIQAHLKNHSRKKLSRTAMETLAIVAYKQPVSKPEIERIRGVSCDYAIHKLMEKEYVSIAGRADTPGKPILYATSEKFMDHFGLEKISDLPTMQEIAPEARSEVGQHEEIEWKGDEQENGNTYGRTFSQSDSEE